MVSRRVKRTLGVALLVVLGAVGGFVFVARRFIFPEHLNVVSIRTTSAYQDGALLARAWRLPVAAAYRHGPLLSQPNGSICGPTSLADVMRSLGLGAETPEHVVIGTGHCSIANICFGGVTLDELAQIARDKTHRKVTVLRDLTLAQFRAELSRSNDPARRYILNFDRGPLFGTVGGHHSPIGGYLPDLDLVFVLDVNAKYQPWLVSSERLFRAMDTRDSSTAKKRGMLLIE